MSQLEYEEITCSQRQAREMRVNKSRLVLVFLLIGLESRARFANQSQSEAKPLFTRITVDIQLKTALKSIKDSKSQSSSKKVAFITLQAKCKMGY